MAQVDQTQKYSSLLAQRLGAGAEEVLALPPPQATPKPAQSEAQPSAPSSSQQALVKAEAAVDEEDGPRLALANEADVEMAEPNDSAVAPAARGLQVRDINYTVFFLWLCRNTRSQQLRLPLSKAGGLYIVV